MPLRPAGGGSKRPGVSPAGSAASFGGSSPNETPSHWQHGRRQYKRLKTGPREKAQSTLGFAAAPAPADYDGHTQMEADRAEHGMDWNPGVEPCKR